MSDRPHVDSIDDIADERIDFLIAMWEESHWFPPYLSDATRERKRERVREWLANDRPMIKARRNDWSKEQ